VGLLLADLLGPGSLSLDALESSEPERFALFRAVATALHDRDRPLLVGLDDAHYAEPAALLLLRFLAGALERRPVVLLLARRPDAPADAQAAAVLDEFERDSTLLPLRPFDTREATEFLTRAAGAGPIRPDLIDAVLRATGGVPVFLARAAAHGLAESGRTDVRQVMVAALDRLSEHSRASMAAAAVLGPRCSVGEVAALRGRSRSAVVDDLQRATGLVAIETTEVSIAHELVRDAALAQMDAATLLDLHASAAQALAGTGPAARFARHALAAAPRSDADAELAVSAARRAGDELRRVNLRDRRDRHRFLGRRCDAEDYIEDLLELGQGMAGEQAGERGGRGDAEEVLVGRACRGVHAAGQPRLEREQERRGQCRPDEGVREVPEGPARIEAAVGEVRGQRDQRVQRAAEGASGQRYNQEA
jgi:predicted ATPase